MNLTQRPSTSQICQGDSATWTLRAKKYRRTSQFSGLNDNSNTGKAMTTMKLPRSSAAKS